MQKKADPVISVIVPVYQVEPYLRECLDSILHQSFRDWELLLIDDGSLDAGGAICDEYAARDGRIRVFHQKNRGLSAARNVGLDHARGAYVTMVDSDDVLLSHDYFKDLLEALEQNDAEISVCGILTFSDEEELPSPVTIFPGSRIISGREVFGEQDMPDCFCFGAAHMKLYRRRVFSSYRYPVGRIVEDYASAHHLLYPCKKIAVLGKCIYGYRIRNASIMRGADGYTLYMDYLAAARERVQYFHERGETLLEARAQRKLRGYSAWYYLRALERGDAKRIPGKDRPSAKTLLRDMEQAFSRNEIKGVLCEHDPHHRTLASRQFREKEAQRAVWVLSLVRDAVLQEQAAAYADGEKEEKNLLSLAREEQVGSMFCKAMLRRKDCAARQKMESILAKGEERWVRQQTDVACLERQMTALGVRGIRLEGFLLQGCYPAGWMWNKNDLSYLLCREDAKKLSSTLEQMGYSAATPCAEACTVWKKKPYYRITLAADVAHGLQGRAKTYFQEVTKRLWREGRSLTPEEVYLLLLARLRAALRGERAASLADVADMGLLWHRYGDAMDQEKLKKELQKLSLQGLDTAVRPMAARVFAAPFTEDDFTPAQKSLLIRIKESKKVLQRGQKR